MPQPDQPTGPQASVLDLLRPGRIPLLCSAVASALAAAAGLVPFIAITELGRLGISDRLGSQDVWQWVTAGALGGLARLLLLGLSSHCGHYADSTVQRYIRARVIEHVGSLPLGWFTQSGSAQLKKAVHDDVEEMHQLIAHAIGDVVGGVAVTVTGFVYLLVVDWRMALVSIAVIPFFVLAFRLSMRSSGRRTAQVATAVRKINVATVELLDGIQVLKTFGKDNGAERRFESAVAEHESALRDWAAEAARTSAATRILMAGPTVLLLVAAVGIPLTTSGHMAAGDLLPFLLLGIGLPKPFVPIVQGGQQLRRARTAARHIQEVLGVTALPEPPAAEAAAPRDGTLEFDDVTFSYDGTVNAVDGINLVCRPGTVTALVGPSGSGKTTLARLVARFHDVTAGAVRIGGSDVRTLASQTLLSNVSLVFQDVVLLRDTVAENIRVGCPGASDEAVRDAARAAGIHDVIEKLPQGYNTVLDGVSATGLSGGERQRLTVARALLQDAPIVVLDEATSSLDPEGEAAVQEALSALTAGRTVLVIAHRLHTIADADQIVVLDGGRITESGTHEQLLQEEGRYARMWAAQAPFDAHQEGRIHA